MKKTMKLLSLIAVVVLMSGCVKYDIGMEVGKDNSVSISLTSAISNSLADYASDSDDSEKSALEKKGYTVKEYKDDKWTGFTYTKKYDNIDKISTKDSVKVELSDIMDSEKEDIKYFFQKKSSLFKTTYVANFTIDTTSDSSDETDESTTADDSTTSNDMIDTEGMTEAMMTSMELNYHITLPVKADEHNATTVSNDGKELSWKLEYGKVNEIKYEFTKTNTTALYGCVIGGVLLILLVVILVVLKVSKKKKPNNNEVPGPGSVEVKNEPSGQVVPPVTDQEEVKPVPTEQPTPMGTSQEEVKTEPSVPVSETQPPQVEDTSSNDNNV